MKNKYFKRILCLALTLLLVTGVLPASAIEAEETPDRASEGFDWTGFLEFSAEVSKLLGETMEDGYISAVTLEVGSGEMVVDGEEYPVVAGQDVTPIAKDEIIMLPVQALADHENAAVSYDFQTNTTTVQTQEGEIAFSPGKETAIVSNGETGEVYTPLDTEPELIDGTLYVPLETMADFLGYDTEIVEDKVLLTKPYQTKRLIVKSAEDTLETYGALREISGFQDLHILQYGSEKAAREAHEKLRLTDTVEYVEPDLVVSTMGTHKSWGTDYIGADTYNNYLQQNTDLGEVVVAVIDTGVDSTHEFLRDRIIPVNKNFVDSKPNSNDGNGHGTHVAGIVVDATLSNVKILPVKVLNDSGAGTSLSAYNGMMFAMQQNCDVINMSLGGFGKSELEEDAIKTAVSKNIAVVVAAGNDGVDASIVSPARTQEAITVGAITSGGYRASYSNYGTVVDIWAPGSDVLSSIPGNAYGKKSGTSMASPLVAAAAAMLKTFDRGLSPRQIESIIQDYGVLKSVYVSSGTNKVLSVAKLHQLNRETIREVVATPTVSLKDGYYSESKTISISCETPGAVIRYTTDGTVPTAGTGTVYTGPLTLQSSAWLNIRAFKTDCIDSYNVERVYYISDYPESFHYRKYDYYDTWTYVCPDKNAKYLKITFDENSYIPFPSEWENGSNSYYSEARLRKLGLYLYNAKMEPVNNEYADIDRNYFIFDELTGKSIIVAGNRFSLLLNCPLTGSDYGFKIKSVEPLYEERLSAPVFVTPHGNNYYPRQEYARMMLVGCSIVNYTENKTVVLSSPEGGDIYYTLDGSLPTRDSLRYEGPITLDEPKKIRAKAFKDGYVESETVLETYFSSKYPESLHGQKRDYYGGFGWDWQAPSNVKWMAITFDDKTYLGRNGSINTLRLHIYNSIYSIGRLWPTEFYAAELAGRTLYIKGNYFRLFCRGNLPEGIEAPYGFKITDIQYYYNEDDIIPIESIEITGPDSIVVGRPTQITATVTPANSNVGFFWRTPYSQFPGGIYVSIDENGVVTGEKAGKTRLIATSNLVNTIHWPESTSSNPYYSFNGDRKDITVLDEPTPTGTVRYSTESLTNQDVVATVIPSDPSIQIANNNGSASHTFTSNGKFTFQLVGVTGKKGSVTATVDWIDKIKPTAELVCDPATDTNGDVRVTMIPSEPVTITRPVDGSATITMTENGTARFEFVDQAGNTGFAEKEVTWIHKVDIETTFSYKTLEDGSVKAVLHASKPITVLNNGGSSEYVFTQNGSFTFEYQYDGDKRGSATAHVSWIEDPIIYIYSVNDLVALSEQTNRGDLEENTSVYLEADLDMTGVSWTPIGTYYDPFSAAFHGNGHTISHLNSEGDSYCGLFGCTSTNAVIEHLKMEDVLVVSNVAGSIAGLNRGLIENCAVSGEVRGLVDTGGIAGQNEGSILDCHMRGNLIRRDIGNAGGITGFSSGSIYLCSMSGTITAETGDRYNGNSFCGLGGIAGSLIGAQISCCYTEGTIICSKENIALGGIAGTQKRSFQTTTKPARDAWVACCYSTMVLQNSGTQSDAGNGGISGTVVQENLGVEGCIALNKSITANHDLGRMVGNVVGKLPEEEDYYNYAFSGMLLGESTVEDDPVSPLTPFNGEGASKEEIRTKAFWDAALFSFEDLFEGGEWIWEEGKMPYTRKDMAFDWPAWLQDKEPDPAVLTIPPAAKADLVYNGQPQALIEPGAAEGGRLLYRLGESGAYSKNIPTAVDAGPYTVWYQVVGDDLHTGLTPTSLTATIGKADQPEYIPENVTVPVGTTLSQISLPAGWHWKDLSQPLLTGQNTVGVVYEDTKNYVRTEFTVIITVEASESELTYEITALDPSILPEAGALEVKLGSNLEDIYDQLTIKSTRLSLTASNGEMTTMEVPFRLREAENPEYDPLTEKLYLLRGYFPGLPENIKNSQDLQVKVYVMTKKYRIYASQVTFVTAPTGTPFEDLPLPEYAGADLNTHEFEMLPVTWSEEGYQPNSPKPQKIYGTYDTPLPVYLENPSNYQPSVFIRRPGQTAPTATVAYSTDQMTNQNVVATITSTEVITVTNNSGSPSYTFTENGSFTFEFKNEAGDTGSVTATVDWIDREPPVITLRGENPQVLQTDKAYVELGADVTDNMDREIKDKLTIDSSAVNMKKAGSYAVKYSATDSAGNHTELTRTVKVNAPAPPTPPTPDKPSQSSGSSSGGSSSGGSSSGGSSSSGSTPSGPVSSTAKPPEPEQPEPLGVLEPDPIGPDTPEPCPRDETCPLSKFSDVNRNAWYHDGVCYALENGLFLGLTETEFGPNVAASRAMLVSVLYRLEGSPQVSKPSPFEDVKAGKYYTNAVIWAAERDIVCGYGNGDFRPNDSISREQLAVILWRYAGSPESTGSLDGFTDSQKAHKYAEVALRWATEQKIMSGRGKGILDPQGNATRAEAATMLMNYCAAVTP